MILVVLRMFFPVDVVDLHCRPLTVHNHLDLAAWCPLSKIIHIFCSLLNSISVKRMNYLNTIQITAELCVWVKLQLMLQYCLFYSVKVEKQNYLFCVSFVWSTLTNLFLQKDLNTRYSLTTFRNAHLLLSLLKSKLQTIRFMMRSF